MKIGLQTWGTEGDVRPFMAMAAQLVNKGHSVVLSIASVEGKCFDQFAGKYGFEIEHIHAVPDNNEQRVIKLYSDIQRMSNPLSQMRSALTNFLDPCIDDLAKGSARLAEQCDVVIAHPLLFPVHAFCEIEQKPFVTLTPNHMGIPSAAYAPLGLPNLGCLNPYLWKIGKFVTNLYMKDRINRFRKKLHLEPRFNVMDGVWASCSLDLVAVSKVFCESSDDWPDQHQVCGFLTLPSESDDVPDPALMEFIHNGTPPFYMTFGSMLTVDAGDLITSEAISIMIEAVRRSGVRAIIQAPWDRLGNVPDAPGIYPIGFAPHDKIFPLCRAVIHHGGAGTTQAACRAGCPSIVVYHLLDQSFWAAQMSRLNVATSPIDRKKLTAQNLADRINDILSKPEMKRSAEEIARNMAEEQSIDKAIERLEKLIAP